MLLLDNSQFVLPAISHARKADGVVIPFNTGSFLTDAVEHHGAKKGTHSLKLTIRASASGVVINHRVYPGVHVRDSIPSWTDDYAKPILVTHNDESDPVGRIQQASFKQYVNDELLARDWMRPILIIDADKNPSIHPSGEVFCTAVITDQAVIPKFLDRRFDTVSQASHADNLICSICNTDWIQNGLCSHRPGKIYSVKPAKTTDSDAEPRKVRMFLRTGVLSYKHLAFVNTPAYTKAGIVESELITSDVLDEFEEYEGTVPGIQADIENLVFIADNQAFVVVENGKNVSESISPIVLLSTDSEKHCQSYLEVGDKNFDLSPESKETETVELSDTEFAQGNVLKGLFDAGMLDLSDEHKSEFKPDEILDLIAKFETATFSAYQNELLENSSFGESDLRLFPLPDEQHRLAARGVLSRFKGDQAKVAERIGASSTQNGDGMKFTTEELADALILGSIYDAGFQIDPDKTDETEDEIQAKIKKLDEVQLTDDQVKLLGLKAEDLEDKVLTAKARKKISANLFCGPDRSFPVPDCAHVANAKSRLPQSNAPNKQKIMACILRRQKSLNCFQQNKKTGDAQSVGQEDMLNRALCAILDSNATILEERQRSKLESEAKDEVITQLTEERDKAHECALGSQVDQILLLKEFVRDSAVSTKVARDEFRAELLKRSLDSLKDTLADAKRAYETAKSSPSGKVEPGVIGDSGLQHTSQNKTDQSKPVSPSDKLADTRARI